MMRLHVPVLSTLLLAGCLLFAGGLLPESGLRAQVTGSWMSAEIEIDLPKKFTIESSLESRAIHTGGYLLTSYFLQAGLNYKISKRFDMSLKYRLANSLEEDRHYYPRTKFLADFKFDYPLGRFGFNYRARYHRLSKTYIDNEIDQLPVHFWRNKFEFAYDIHGNKLEPAVFLEMFTPLNGFNTGPFDEVRIGAFAKYPLHKKHRLSGGIMYIHEQWETRLSGIIFQFGYKYELD